MNKNLRKVLSIAMAALLIAGVYSISMFLSAASETDPPNAEEEVYVQPAEPIYDLESISQRVNPQAADAGTAQESAPGQTQESAPEQVQESNPVQAQESAPEQAQESAPVQAQESAPVQAQESAPVQAQVSTPEQEPAQNAPQSAEPEVLYGSINGLVWVDGNKNGLRDDGESTLSGCPVLLFYENRIREYNLLPDTERVIMNLPDLCALIYTDTNGTYKFEGLDPGYYVVAVYAETVSNQEYLPPVSITPNTDNKFNLDSTCDAPYIAFTDPIELRAGQVIENINAGMRWPEDVASEPSGAQSGEAQAETTDYEAPADTTDGTAPVAIQSAIATLSYALPVDPTAQDDGTVPPQDDNLANEGTESIETAAVNALVGFAATNATIDNDFSDLIMSTANTMPASVTLSVNINSSNPDREKLFVFEITVRNESSVVQCNMQIPYVYSKLPDSTIPSLLPSGTVTTDGLSGLCVFGLRHGDSETLFIDHSDYQIKIAQRATSGYNPSYTATGDLSANNGDTGFVLLNSIAFHTFDFTETPVAASAPAPTQTNITISMPVPATNVDREKFYTFRLYLLDQNGSPIQNGSLIQYTFTAQAGYVEPLAYPSSGSLNIGSGGDGMATILLSQGYSLKLLNIRSDYQIKLVQVTTDATFTGNFTDTGGSSGTTDTGFRPVSSMAERTISFVPTGAGASSLSRNVKITKKIAGTSSPLLDKPFYFYVYLKTPNGQNVQDGYRIFYNFTAESGSHPWSDMYASNGGSIYFGSGKALVVLRHGYNLELLNIPTDYLIRVEETFLHYYQSYTPSFIDSDGASGAFDTGEGPVGGANNRTDLRTIAFTNTRGPGVKITKTITNANPPNRSVLFTFDVYLYQGNTPVPVGSRIEYTFTALSGAPITVYEPHAELNFGADGKATLPMYHGYSVTLHLREGFRVRIVERDHPSYTTTFTDTQGDNGGADTDFRNVSGTAREFIFTNRRGSGVTIKKTIPNVTPELYSDNFMFNVTLQNQGRQPVPQGTLMEYTFTSSITNPTPHYPGAGVLNFSETGVAAFPMRHGYEMTIYLREDYYAGVKEFLDDDEYVGSHTVNGVSGYGVDTGVSRVNADPKTIEFINEHNRGNVTISKMVAGLAGSKTREFTFTIYFKTSVFGGSSVSAGTVIPYTGGIVPGSGAAKPADGSLTLDLQGKATFKLRHGQTVTFNLQGSWGFQVIETLDTNYSTTYTDSSDNSTGGLDTNLKPVGRGSKTIAYVNTSTIVPTGIEDTNRSAWVFTATAGFAVISSLMFTVARKRRGRGAHHHA